MPIAVLATVAALTAGCRNCANDKPAGRSSDSGAEPASSAPAVSATAAADPPAAPAAGPAIAEGTFSKFFPRGGQGDTTQVMKLDRGSYAEARLSKDGKEIAVLAIVDAQKLAFVKARFDEATDKLEGYPVMKLGDHQTTLLVKGRYQVKVTSQTLDDDARKAILATFDLKGLNAL